MTNTTIKVTKEQTTEGLTIKLVVNGETFIFDRHTDKTNLSNAITKQFGVVAVCGNEGVFSTLGKFHKSHDTKAYNLEALIIPLSDLALTSIRCAEELSAKEIVEEIIARINKVKATFKAAYPPYYDEFETTTCF